LELQRLATGKRWATSAVLDKIAFCPSGSSVMVASREATGVLHIKTHHQSKARA
jgi:hypothetical protein